MDGLEGERLGSKPPVIFHVVKEILVTLKQVYHLRLWLSLFAIMGWKQLVEPLGAALDACALILWGPE
jgi:hypothetical protein